MESRLWTLHGGVDQHGGVDAGTKESSSGETSRNANLLVIFHGYCYMYHHWNSMYGLMNHLELPRNAAEAGPRNRCSHTHTHCPGWFNPPFLRVLDPLHLYSPFFILLEMLHPLQSTEGGSVSCNPLTCSVPLHHLQYYRFTDFSPQSKVLEINPDRSGIGFNSHNNNKRAAPSESYRAGPKRVKIAYDASTPASTPTSSPPNNATPQSTQLVYGQIENTNDNRSRPRLSIHSPSTIDAQLVNLSTTHSDIDIAPISSTIVEARKALTAMGRALSSGKRASVERHLIAAMETLRICHFGYFGFGVERPSTLESGEVTQEPYSPVFMIDDVGGIGLFSKSSYHHTSPH